MLLNFWFGRFSYPISTKKVIVTVQLTSWIWNILYDYKHYILPWISTCFLISAFSSSGNGRVLGVVRRFTKKTWLLFQDNLEHFQSFCTKSVIYLKHVWNWKIWIPLPPFISFIFSLNVKTTIGPNQIINICLANLSISHINLMLIHRDSLKM